MNAQTLSLLVTILTSCEIGSDKDDDDCTHCFEESTRLPTDYQLVDNHWACAADSTTERMQVKVNGSNVFLSNVLVSLDGDDMVGVVSDAMDDWHDQGADVYFDSDIGPTTASQAEISSQEEASDDDAGALAGVSCRTTSSSTCENRSCILIVMENVVTEDGTTDPIAWVLNDPPTSDEHSLSYAVTHELGHVLGLDDQGSSYEGNAIMYRDYAAGTSNPGVQAADAQALRYM